MTQSARSSPRFIRLVESFCFLLFKANRNTGFHSVSQLNVSIQVQSSSAVSGNAAQLNLQFPRKALPPRNTGALLSKSLSLEPSIGFMQQSRSVRLKQKIKERPKHILSK